MNREEMLKHLENDTSPLEVSIMKWEELRNNPTCSNDIGSETCGLCNDCSRSGHGIICEKCVVFHHTHEHGCKYTPYEHFAMNRTKYNASRMVAFLKSLRNE